MIIGSGLLATAMAPYFDTPDDVLVFAAGVSNSHCKDSNEFAREARRLDQALNKYKEAKFFLYFSTCSIYDPESVNTPYVLHKINMENKVRLHHGHLIVRLPQVAGNTPNPHTVLNYLYARIARGETFTVWSKARRNFIDCDDIAKIVWALIKNNEIGKTINIANDFDHSILEVVQIFEKILNKNATFNSLNHGGAYNIDTSHTTSYAYNAEIQFNDAYLERILRKYYENSEQ